VDSELAAQTDGEVTPPMNGTLEDTTPAGVLQVLSSQHSTGAVRFHGESGCTVYLHRGELYFAESGETAEDLAVALVRPGRLTAEEWDASTDAGYPTETVGETLIETGGITRELLASVVLSVIYDPLIQLFRAPVGDYEFAPDVVHWIGPFRTFDVDAIVSEVRRRTREADEMAPVVPSLNAVVRSARTLPESHGSVNLRRDDWEVVVAAANGCTVSELAVELGRGRWSTARIVYRLASADLLMVTADDSAIDGDSFESGSFGASPFDVGSFDTAADDAPSGDAAGFAPTAFDATPAAASAFDAGVTDADTADRSATDYGFDAPPPLDPSLIDAGAGADTSTIDDDPWKLDEPASSTASDDPWGEFDSGSTETGGWDPGALYGDASTETSGPATTDAESGSPWGGDLTAVPDAGTSPFGDDGGVGGDADMEPPALHPDIAKALAESTYADSATAINAMAARLGAIESDDDDEWDTPAGADDTGGDEFWSDGGSGSGNEDFIWKPAVWDTGVESAPLPQREAARTATAAGGEQSGDPAWLDNLYAEFMPGDADAGAAADTRTVEAADPGAAPKQRTLRRLISAIRRL